MLRKKEIARLKELERLLKANEVNHDILNDRLAIMQRDVRVLYDAHIMEPLVPHIVKMQRFWRGIVNRAKLMEQLQKLVTILRMFKHL